MALTDAGHVNDDWSDKRQPHCPICLRHCMVGHPCRRCGANVPSLDRLRDRVWCNVCHSRCNGAAQPCATCRQDRSYQVARYTQLAAGGFEWR